MPLAGPRPHTFCLQRLFFPCWFVVKRRWRGRADPCCCAGIPLKCASLWPRSDCSFCCSSRCGNLPIEQFANCVDDCPPQIRSCHIAVQQTYRQRCPTGKTANLRQPHTQGGSWLSRKSSRRACGNSRIWFPSTNAISRLRQSTAMDGGSARRLSGTIAAINGLGHLKSRA